MRARRPLRLAVVALIAGLAAGGLAHAFDLGNINLDKVLDLGKKAAQATSPVPVEQEIAVGRGLAASLLGASRLVNDPVLQQYVNRVGRWLAAQTERADLPWRFGVLDSDSVNAFAAPGGYVFVTRGLVRGLNSESELAGVLAHEIAHVLRRHHIEAIRKQAMTGLAADLVGMAAQQKNVDLTPFIKTGMQLYARGLDREDEYEADRLGVVIATRAGYEPYGLPRVLIALQAVQPGQADLQLLNSTHPPTAERLGRLEALMAGRFAGFESQPQVPERFVAMRDRIR